MFATDHRIDAAYENLLYLIDLDRADADSAAARLGVSLDALEKHSRRHPEFRTRWQRIAASRLPGAS